MEMNFFEELHRLQRSLENLDAKLMEKYDGNPPDLHCRQLFQLHAIRAQKKEGELLYVSDVTESLHDTPQSISRMLRKLELAGLIERHTDPVDRRRTYLVFTEEGEKKYRSGADMLHMMQEKLEEEAGSRAMVTYLAAGRELEEAMRTLTKEQGNSLAEEKEIRIEEATGENPVREEPNREEKDKKKDKKSKKNGKTKKK